MDNKEDQVKNKKGFFARMIEKLDKKMREKAAQSCCCGKGGTNKSSCCN